MIGFIKKNLSLNKAEKSAIFTIMCTLTVAFGVCNITWICKQFGLNIGTNVINTIIDSMTAGATLSQAFAMIVGFTLPAWAAAAAGALATTAA